MRVIVATAFLLCACQKENPDQIQAPPTQDATEYGPLSSITGIFSRTPEAIALVLCSEDGEHCNHDAPEACWTKFTPVGDTQATKLLGPKKSQYDDYGEYWFEGTGKVARKPGGFGHLDAYNCEILVDGVRVIRKLPAGWEL
jgi:hypothetical protein